LASLCPAQGFARDGEDLSVPPILAVRRFTDRLPAVGREGGFPPAPKRKSLAHHLEVKSLFKPCTDQESQGILKPSLIHESSGHLPSYSSFIFILHREIPAGSSPFITNIFENIEPHALIRIGDNGFSISYLKGFVIRPHHGKIRIPFRIIDGFRFLFSTENTATRTSCPPGPQEI